MKCINTKHPDFLKLVEETNLSPIVLDMKIGKWQEENGSDSFPSAEVLLSTSELNTVMKSVDILQSEKAKQIFAKGEKNNWDLNKILTELQIPKEQKQLILDLNINDREQLALELASKYSYTVEINTAKAANKFNTKVDEYGNDLRDSFDDEENSFYHNGYLYEKDTRHIPFGFARFKDNNWESISSNSYWSALEQKEKEGETSPTQYYSNLTVPGGTNYTEQEISTPLITPSIKGHAQFATDNGIGWFRSDEKLSKESLEEHLEEEEYQASTNLNHIKGSVRFENAEGSKTRRILELQSDLFQKGRDKQNLTNAELQEDVYEKDGKYYFYDRYAGQFGEQDTFEISKEKYEELKLGKNPANNFLQLLNKDNNWVTFFIKSIIQDSAKKGYEKVLFPSGDTASKIEGHQTLADELKRIDEKINKETDRVKKPILERFNSINEKILNLQNKNVTDKYEHTYISNKYKGLSINGIIVYKVHKENKGLVYTNIRTGESVSTEFSQLSQLANELNIKDFGEGIRKEDKELRLNSLLEEKKKINKELEDADIYLEDGLQYDIQRRNQLKSEGIAKLKPIYNFYENTVTNILKKQGYNAKLITDEYGNTWNEIEIKDSRDLSPIQYSKGLGQPTATQIRRELSIPYKGSEVQLTLVRERLSRYNDKYNTSHRLPAISLNKANTEYGFVLELNFNPVNQEAKDARKKAKRDPDQYSLFEQSTEDFISKRKISKLTFPEVNGYVESFKDFHNIVMSHILNHPTKYQHEIDPQTNSPAFIIDSISILRNLARVNQTFKEEIFKIDLAPNGVTPTTRMVTVNNDAILGVYERRVIEMEESVRNEGLKNQYDKRLPDIVIEEESLDKTAEKIAKLSAAFPNAEVIMDGDMDENTFGSIQYINGIPTIRLNAKGVKSDTVIHEFGHLFIDSLGGMSNPFIKRGRDLLRGSKIEADVISVYGDELSGEALDKEILTTAVGIEGANLEKMSPFKQWIKIFFNKLKLALGIRGNVALELAQRMLNNEVSSVTRFANLPNYIQYSKVQSEKGPTSLQDRKMNQVINNLLDKITILKHKYKKSPKGEKFKENIEEILKDLVRAKDAQAIIRYLDDVGKMSTKVLKELNDINIHDNIDGQLIRNLRTFSGIFDIAKEVKQIVSLSQQDLKEDISKYLEKGLLTVSEEGIYSISENITTVEESEVNTTLGIFLSLQAKIKTINTIIINTSDIQDMYNTLSSEFMLQQLRGSVGRIKGEYRYKFEKEYNKVTLKSSRSKEGKLAYINNKMQENEAKIELETGEYLRKIIASSPKDYNGLEAWLSDPKNLDGTIIGFVVKTLEEADYLADRAYLDEEKTAAEILENYKKFKGSTNNMEKLYSDFIERDSKGNPTGYMVGEFLSSSGEFSGIPNPQYNKIRELRAKDSKHPMVEMYDYLVSISAKKDANLPEAYKLGKSISSITGEGDVVSSVTYKFPSIEKGSIERISEQGLGTFFMEGLKDIYQRDTSYTESGELLVDDNNKIKSEKTTLNAKKVIVDEAGKERQDIPIHFRAGIRTEGQQSYDLVGILLADYHMSENYKQKSAVRHVAEIALDVVGNNTVTQRTGGALKINALSRNQNPLQKDGDQSNVYKVLNSIVQQRLYGISSIDLGDVTIKGKEISINKILNGIMTWTGDTLLMANSITSPVNLLQGKLANWMEGLSGGFFNTTNSYNGEKKYWKDFKNIVDDSLGSQVVKSKTNLLRELFSVGDSINIGKKFADSNRLIRMSGKNTAYALNSGPEHYIQSHTMYAILDNIKVMSPEGVEVPLDEAYEVKGNRLVLKTGFNVSLETEAKVSSRIKEVLKQLHGNYDSKNLAMIQRHAGGKMAYAQRKWLIPGVQRRWKGASTFYKKSEDLEDTDIFYSEILDQRIEGYYTTTMRYLNQVRGDLFKLQLGLVASKWDEMTDYEKANVRKTIMDAALVTLTILAGNLIIGLAKDADDEDKEMYYRMAYTFRRLQGETTFYININETLKIMSSPSSSISMIQNVYKAGDLLFTDPLAKYKIGDRKGEYKLKKKVFKLFPVLSQVDRDVVEVYEWLENI